MSLWPDTEFQRVGMNTKLSRRTLDACRDVLVDGISGVDAANRHQMAPAQISRALGVLREKKEDISKSAALFRNEDEVFKYVIAQTAKNIAGENLIIVDAQPGQAYQGKIIVSAHGFAVQQIGRSAVMHNLGQLEKIPTLNAMLAIAYPREGGLASVSDVLAVDRTKGLGR